MKPSPCREPIHTAAAVFRRLGNNWGDMRRRKVRRQQEAWLPPGVGTVQSNGGPALDHREKGDA